MRRCRCNERAFIDQDTGAPRFERVITTDSPIREYSREAQEWAPLHVGQMKLLISEIEFLTPFYGRSFVVVYAGAAPGVHMPILAGMFPTMHFLLIDPVPSMIENGDYINVTILQEPMTDALAHHIVRDHQRNILFISDVRVGSQDPYEPEAIHQARVQRDMEAQRVWLQILRPRMSILKFRLPWNQGNGVTYYPAGFVYLPVYGKQFTHEARLVVDRDTHDIPYDHRRYEGQMAHFNQVNRPALYPSRASTRARLGLEHAQGVDEASQDVYRCYDCTAFQAILGEYLLKTGQLDPYSMHHEAIDAECLQLEMRLNYFYQVWNAMRASGVVNMA